MTQPRNGMKREDMVSHVTWGVGGENTIDAEADMT